MYNHIGSLKAALALNYIKSKKLDKKKEEFDICLISEFLPSLDKDWSHIQDFQEKLGKIANYVYRLANEMNLKIIFTGKAPSGFRTAEKTFYQHYLKDYSFKINKYNIKNFSTYVNIQKSRLIIGLCSTSLRESFLFKKKVLACNFTGHKTIIFPSKGISTFNQDVSYKIFKKELCQFYKCLKRNIKKKFLQIKII